MSLLARFGVLSAVLVIGLGVVLAAALRDTVASRALAQAEQTAALVVRMAVQPQLHASDFERGKVAADRLEQLRATLRSVGTDGDVLRVKVYDDRGTLLYSDEADLIGERHSSGDLSQALAGGIASEIEAEGHEDSEQGFGTLLEVYVPVWMRSAGDQQVVGAFEMYLPYGPIERGAAADVRQLLWSLGLGMVALWAGLFQLVATASRRLRQHADTNQWLAHHDSLTRLPNRTLFAEEVSAATRNADRSHTRTAVLLVNLDRFKQVNEALGHRIGDALLGAAGGVLQSSLGDRGLVARVGGDEFAVLLPAVEDEPAARNVAVELLTALRAPIEIGDMTLEIDAGVGMALYPDHGTPDILLQRADVALYRAKQRHDDVVVYGSDLDIHTPTRLALFGELRRAIEDDALTLHYQPKVDVTLGSVPGVEALVRWHHPRHGMLAPAEFIPLAEQTGLIRPLTTFVLEQALADCRAWRAQGLDLSVAVNLSAPSLLDEGLPRMLEDLLHRYELPVQALELEITETTAMADPGRALDVLEALQQLGIRLSVDDYGTGHSSLSYLQQLPVHTLKIDKIFVQTMDTNLHRATIVRSTVDLARSLGLQVVAEGVETETAWLQLRALGCDAAQGYWLARPGPAATVPTTVAAVEEQQAQPRGASARQTARGAAA